AGDAVLGGEDPGRRDDRGRAGLPAVGEQPRGPGTAGGVTAADDGLRRLGDRGRRGLGRGGGRAEECEDGDRGGGERGNEPGYAQGFLDSTCTQGDAGALWGTRPGEEHRTAPHPNSGPGRRSSMRGTAQVPGYSSNGVLTLGDNTALYPAGAPTPGAPAGGRRRGTGAGEGAEGRG